MSTVDQTDIRGLGTMVAARFDEELFDWVRMSDGILDTQNHTLTIPGISKFSIFVLAFEPPVATERISWSEIKSRYR